MIFVKPGQTDFDPGPQPTPCCTKRRQIIGLGLSALLSLVIVLSSTLFREGPSLSSQGSKNETVPFELTGSWNDGFNTIVVVTAANWTEIYSDNTVVVRHIRQYTNPIGDEEGVIIAQNDRSNTWYPSKWNRIHYFHYRPEIWHFCTVYYDKDTQEAAATPPDHPELFNVDNVTTGCGGFPMSVLLPLA